MDKLCIRIPPNFPVRFQQLWRGVCLFVCLGGAAGRQLALTDKSVGVLAFQYRSAGMITT